MLNSKSRSCVIVGASHAGAQMAESVRRSGWEGKVLLVGEENCLPYHRPPLSKDFLINDKGMDSLLIRPAEFYEKLNIELRLGCKVKKIHRAGKTLQLDDGSTLTYDKLGLAVGARVRQISLPGFDRQGVFYTRTIEDIENIRPYVATNKDAVIVGGGYIGLETAATLRKLGMNVTVLEMMPRILQRVTAPKISEFFHRVHLEEGVKIVTDVAVEEILGGEKAESVRCSNGCEYPADLVIVGAGIVPNVELAHDAGLEVNNGIVVDEHAQASDPDIVAAGDCAWHHNSIYDRFLRLESVQNANDQAKTAGGTICGIKSTYDELPWFWSDQYDLKLQIAGLSQNFDDVVIRGDIENSRQFAAFYFQESKLIAVDAVNMGMAFMVGKRLLQTGTAVSKAMVADESVELKALMDTG